MYTSIIFYIFVVLKHVRHKAVAEEIYIFFSLEINTEFQKRLKHKQNIQLLLFSEVSMR